MSSNNKAKCDSMIPWDRIYYEQLNKLVEHWVLDLSTGIHDRELVAYQTCTCRTNLQCLPIPTMSSYSPISDLVDKEQYGTNGKTEKTKILCPPPSLLALK